MVTLNHQLQVEHKTAKVRRSKTDVLPLCHAYSKCCNFSFVFLTTYNKVHMLGQGRFLGMTVRKIKHGWIWFQSILYHSLFLCEKVITESIKQQ